VKRGGTKKPRGGRPLRRWYLLIHQLPPRPLYLRAKVRQRLARVGAIALKNAVYALPFREESLEDFQWIAEEAVAGGGEAYVCASEFADRATEEALVARFRQERAADYAALADSIRSGRKKSAPAGASPAEDVSAELARARRRLSEIVRIDFFGAPRREAAERALAELERRVHRRSPPPRGGRRAGALVGRMWVTRRGIQVDRIASAWLVRRFIDAKARFRFVDPAEPAATGELRFDMVDGDFTHEGDACTFETLAARAGISDPAVRALAEIVHDIDLKDGKFGRPEARGVEQVLAGLLLSSPSDEERLERGFDLFDGLYESFRGKSSRKEIRP
jgi:hypothetical protein